MEYWSRVAGKENLDCGEVADAGCRKNAATRVFEAARELFYHRGIRAVGVDEIVCQAGVTKPSLYRAFASKDQLVAACLEESGREVRAAIDAAIDAAGSDPREQLRALLKLFATKISQPDFRGCAMSNTAVEFPEPGHPGRAVLEMCKAEMRERIGEVTQRLDIADPVGLADGLLLLIEGAMATHHIFGGQGPCCALKSSADALIDAHMARAK
jgi:AcrR family transcriptional regulator